MQTAQARLGSIDFDRLFREYAEMSVWRGAFDKVGLPVVRIVWSAKPGRSSGSCSMQRRSVLGETARGGAPTSRSRIRVTLNRDAKVADVIQTVLHEMTHAAGWMDHSQRFYGTLREAVSMATGVDCNATWTRVYEYDRKQREELDLAFGDDLSSFPKLRRAVPAARPARRTNSKVPRIDVRALTAAFYD